MSARFLLGPLVLFMIGSAATLAQTPSRPTTAPADAQKQSPRAPEERDAQATQARRVNQPVNVKVDVTITDQRASGAPVKKTITVVTGDGLAGRIRSSAEFAGGLGPLPLNVDVSPTILMGGKIRAIVSLQYELPGPQAETQLAPSRTMVKMAIQENLALILDDGKPITAAQSADPISDRQVTIEVKATILK